MRRPSHRTRPLALLCLFLLGATPAAAPHGEASAEKTPADMLAEALSTIEAYYWRPEEVDRAELFVSGVQRLEVLGDDVLVTGPDGAGRVRVRAGEEEATFESRGIESMAVLRSRFGEAVDFVRRHHRASPDDPVGKDAEIELLRGVLRPLDRHCRVIDARRITDFQARYHGTLSGIGARIGREGEDIVVRQPYPGTPSERAGLQPGDVLTHVDGVSTTQMSVDEAVDRIRGVEGTLVVLTVRRPGEDGHRVFPVRREQVRVPSLESRLLEPGIGYVRIDHFSKQSSAEFTEHVAALEKPAGEPSPLRGLVLDLRGNTGGSLVHASLIVQHLVSSGTIVSTQGPDGGPVQGLVHRIAARPGDDLPPIPVVVLVDHRTASGSEIVAGALKFLGRALVVGEETFGKGTVQKVFKFREDVELKITVARYLVADGVWIDQVGVVPDVAVAVARGGGDGLSIPDRLPVYAPKEPGRLGAGWEPTTGAPNDAPSLRVLTAAPEGAEDGFDPELDLAVRVIRAAPAEADRAKLIEVARPLVEAARAEGAKRIAALAAPSGARWGEDPGDWSDRSPATVTRQREALVRPPPPDVRTTLAVDGGRLTAGGKAKLRLAVVNGGRVALPRLRARLRSDLRALDGLDFTFGDVPPGGTMERSLEVEVPSRLPAQVDSVRVYLVADGRLLGGPTETRIAVDGAAWPRFALRWAAERAEVEGRVLLTLPVEVRNDGEGPSGRVVVRLDNPPVPGVELTRGRVEVASLAPGQVETVRLEMALSVGAAAGPLRVRLVVDDRDFGASTRHSFDLDPARSSPPGPWRAPPRIELATDSSGALSGGATFRLTGEARDDTGVVRVLASRGGDRVFAATPKGGSAPSLPFSTEVPIEGGANAISVEAVDAEGLRSFRRVQVLGSGVREGEDDATREDPGAD